MLGLTCQAVRYNYLARDRVATVELIALIKSLSKQLQAISVDMGQYIRDVYARRTLDMAGLRCTISCRKCPMG